jgi:hypothetical protein
VVKDTPLMAPSPLHTAVFHLQQLRT